jgi:BMFP domain-containing protein YqiC
MITADDRERLKQLSHRIEKLEKEAGHTPNPSPLDLLEERVKRLEERADEERALIDNT